MNQPIPTFTPVASPVPVDHSQEHKDLMLKWWHAKVALQSQKDLEASLRKQVSTLPIWQEKSKSVQRSEVAEGYDVCLTYKESMTVDNKKDKMFHLAHAFAQQSPSHASLVKNLLSWKASVNKAVYDSLTPEVRAYFDQAITTKPAATTVEVKDSVQED